MRERTQSLIDPAETASTIATTYLGTCASPWQVNTGPTEYTTGWIPNSFVRVTHDVVTDNFEKRRNQGEIISNPYDSTVTILTDQQWPYVMNVIHADYDCPGGAGRYTGTIQEGYVGAAWACRKTTLTSPYWTQWYAPQPEIDIEALESLAVTDAYAKADTSEAAVLCTLAEAKESVLGILYILKRVRSIRRSLKRFDLKALRKEISRQELQNRYMEARYSIRPLIYDAKQIINAIRSNSKGEKRRVTYRAKKVEQGMTSVEAEPGRTSGTGRTTLAGTAKRDVECRAGVLTDTEVSMIGLWGLDQPIEMIWEIIPFSFVIDWFFNVGKTIAAWTPNVGVHRLASWVVTKDITIYDTWVDSSFVNPSSLSYYNYSAEFDVTGAAITKTVQVTTRKVDIKRDILPRLNVRLDVPKLLDLAIILKQFYR